MVQWVVALTAKCEDLSLIPGTHIVEEALQLVAWCQMASPKNTYTDNSTQAEQIVFRNIHVYTYAYMHAANEREAMNLKKSREDYIGGLKERKGDKEMKIKLQSQKSNK